jgi:hypothetical protein
MIVAHPNKRWVFVRSRLHRSAILADDMADRRITSSATSVLLLDWIPPLGRSSIAFRARSFRHQPHGRIIPRQGPQHKRIPSSSAVDKWGYAGRCSRLLTGETPLFSQFRDAQPTAGPQVDYSAEQARFLPGNQTLNVDHHGQLDVPPSRQKNTIANYQRTPLNICCDMQCLVAPPLFTQRRA